MELKGDKKMKKEFEYLNVLCANLNVLFVKLHNAHWFTKGANFLAMHAKYEELYDFINEEFDAYSERLLQLGSNPPASLRQYIELATISELASNHNLNWSELLDIILLDLNYLGTNLKQGIKVFEEVGDAVTIDMLTGTLTTIEKEIWLLSSLL